MTTGILSHPYHIDEISTDGARRRLLRLMQLIFAGAAALAMLALFDAARPDTTGSVLNSASVRLADMAVPAPSGGGFAADDGDDQAQQQLQQQLQQIQQMQQAEQQAEEQNEAAQQQALQDELQGQQVEQQADQ